MAHQAHVSEAKKAAVARLVEKIDSSPVVGVLDMESLPARNLGAMRKRLRDKVDIVMAKKRLIKIALEKSKKQDIGQLEGHLVGMPALLFTQENPFTLFKTLKRSQSKAPIKAGQTAPENLTIPAGPTSFAPGPIIGELGQLGIKAGIEGGKVVIKQEAVLVKQGQQANDKQAGLLARMGIEPMRIGLALMAVYEDGKVLDKKVLDIDEEAFARDLAGAAAAAGNLAWSIVWPTQQNIARLVQKAHFDAVGLALEANVLTGATVRQTLAKAYYQALGVAKYLPEDMRPQGSALAAEEADEQVPQQETEEKKDHDKEPEDPSAGLGAMFG